MVGTGKADKGGMRGLLNSLRASGVFVGVLVIVPSTTKGGPPSTSDSPGVVACVEAELRRVDPVLCVVLCTLDAGVGHRELEVGLESLGMM